MFCEKGAKRKVMKNYVNHGRSFDNKKKLEQDRMKNKLPMKE